MEGWGKIPIFAGEIAQTTRGSWRMAKEKLFVITGINALTGFREEISGPMPEAAARARLEREIESRKNQRYQPHKKLRIEKRLPVQLTIKFENEDGRIVSY